ncbi:MAG: fluoride efflux transporter CrcB [Candidatus Sericytochromatia bacterium]
MQAMWWVGLGGAAGAIARYYVTLALAARLGAGFPYGTLLVNVTGCFLLGLVGAAVADRAAFLSPEARLLVGVGFCGAYTTFSAFGLETVALLKAGQYTAAAIYVALSNVLGLLAVAGGVYLGRG